LARARWRAADSRAFDGELATSLIVLPDDVIDRLNYLRGPAESYSDVIVRLAKEAA